MSIKISRGIAKTSSISLHIEKKGVVTKLEPSNTTLLEDGKTVEIKIPIDKKKEVILRIESDEK